MSANGIGARVETSYAYDPGLIRRVPAPPVPSLNARAEGAAPAGLCDAVADAATGYGANEIILFSAQPQLASIVPYGVATVVLRFRRRRPIIAHVHQNTYCVAVWRAQ